MNGFYKYLNKFVMVLIVNLIVLRYSTKHISQNAVELFRLNILIVLALILSFFTDFFSESTFSLNLFCVLLISSFGLLHGCSDLKDYFSKGQTKSNASGVGLYIALFLLAAGLLYCFPKVGIIAFIILSGYHFGQQDLANQNLRLNFYSLLFKFAFGLGVLLLMLSSHTEAVNIFLTINLSTSFSPSILRNALPFVLIAQLIFGIVTVLKNKSVWAPFLCLEISLILFFFLFNQVTLLWSFTFYFIFWHSLSSLRHQINDLYGELSKSTVQKYLKSTSIWFAVSISGLLLLFFLMYKFDMNKLAVSLIFAATVPHIITHWKSVKPQGRIL